jgi:hypothetical protein
VSRYLDAFDAPPEVRAVAGEILITGDLVSAAYTIGAAKALIVSLQTAILEAERPGAAGRRRAGAARPA